MLNETRLDLIRTMLLGGPETLTPKDCAFLASLLANHVTGVQANELYLTPEQRPSITQPMPAPIFPSPIVPDDFPQSTR